MSFEYWGKFPKSPSRCYVQFEFEGRSFSLAIHKRNEGDFEFPILKMPGCPERVFDDLATNTFFRDDTRYILFSSSLMPNDWDEAHEFARNWAMLLSAYIERGERFSLSRARDELGERPEGDELFD